MKTTAFTRRKEQNFGVPSSIGSDFDSSGLPESYRNLYEANPYANMKASGGFLGIGKRKEQEQINMRAAEYNANLALQAYSEQYNSPEAQAERLSQAGINPDLSGGIAAGESAASPLSGAEIDFADPAKQIADFSSTLLNIAEIALSVPEGLASISSERIAQGMQIAQAGKMLANEFPRSQKDISPVGSALAPVLVDSTVSASKIAETIPGLSSRQRKQLEKSISLNRQSLRSTISSARDRKELFNLINSPELSFPKIAKEAIELEGKLSLLQLRGALRTQEALSRFSKENAEKQAKNQKRELEVAGEELEARSATASANKALAGAVSSEAKVRSDIARNTDGAQIGLTRTQQAELDGIKAETAEQQLEVIAEAEDEGLFGSSLVGDILTFRVGTGHEISDFENLKDRFRKRRKAKRENKRFYKQSAGTGSISVSPKGLTYSE